MVWLTLKKIILCIWSDANNGCDLLPSQIVPYSIPNTSKDPLNGLMMNLLLFFADLSRNKLTELPPECTDYWSLERLVLYHNAIRSIPDSIVYLQSLQFLDLSRNQLSYLPVSICELPLQVCNHPFFCWPIISEADAPFSSLSRDFIRLLLKSRHLSLNF